MPLSIASNISSLVVRSNLDSGSRQLSQTYERLSSGLRINKASEDPAGLALADALNSDKRVYSQGIRNLNDGISLINIASGAVEELTNIVSKLKELAQQASNGTYSVSQRKAIDTEAQALSDEFLRIVKSTKFNDKNLLDGSMNLLSLQGGYGNNGQIISGLGGLIGTGEIAYTQSYNMTNPLVSAIKLADLNGDGIEDVITGDAGSVTIRLGTGGGSFGSSISYSMSASVRDVAIGDLNGDGVLDIVTGGVGGGTGRATVRLGNGDGTFQAAVSYQMESVSTVAVTLADLDS